MKPLNIAASTDGGGDIARRNDYGSYAAQGGSSPTGPKCRPAGMERRGGSRLEGVAGPHGRAVPDLERCGEKPAHERAKVFYRRQRPPDPCPAGAVESATEIGRAHV